MRLPRRPVPSGEQLGQAGDEGGGVLMRIKDPPRAKQETTQSSEGFLLVTGCWLLVAGSESLAVDQQPATSSQ